MNCWQKWNNLFKKIPGWSIGLCLGIVCLIIGIFHNQLTDIMQKAIMICLECIGIG